MFTSVYILCKTEKWDSQCEHRQQIEQPRGLLCTYESGFALSVSFLANEFDVREAYCKFGNFRENFIFANSIKGHICQVTNSRLWHDLTISVNDNEFSPFRESFIFAKLRIREVSRK